MLWQWSPSVIAEISVGGGLIILAIYFPWRDLNRRTSLIGATLLLVCALWILSHALEIGLPVALYKSYLMGTQLVLGIIAITLWLLYIIHYSIFRRWLIKYVFILSCIVTLIALIAVFTNDIHHLMWTDVGLNLNYPYLPLQPDYGIIYLACMAYTFTLILVGGFLIIFSIVRQDSIRNRESFILMGAAAIPILIAAMEMSGITSSLKISIGMTPWAALIGSILVIWNLPRLNLQRVLPIARDIIFERISDCIILLDMDNRILDLNTAAKQLIGNNLTNLLGFPINQIWPQWPVELSDGNQIIETNREFILKQDGERRIFNLNITPLTKIKGHPINKVILMSDITEQKRMEDELNKNEKLEAIGILAGGIAHDFNNILTAILGNISLAKMETKPESELYTRLEEAEKASLRAKDLTQQLLTFSKGGVPVKKLASVSELLKDTASFALRGSNIKCQFSIPDDLWHAEIDEGQISQIINNMVINAQQAMPTGGTIEVRAENITLTEKQSLCKSLLLKKGKYIRIAVTDHGIGIPEEQLDKIFDPFFTTKQKGSGLGLATSYSVVHNHDGHISVESKVGTGSTFYVYLPASTKTATIKKTEEKETTPVGKARILVMDDEETVREVAGRMLKHIGYEDIECTADGAEAIKLYTEAMKAGKPFDAVILDLTIPGGMGGRETIKKLMEIDPKVKAIVSSGYSSESAIAEYKECGFSGIVAKPYTFDQLRKALHELIC